ncbi:hypothetical protein JVT61DRAFT_10894 [Boletus reticuloceps]|uniref:Uncharacterized protein n=1 Tax=Boletus reticuloceps TaxID=495285 RepID=A0A8I2YFG2_9AGAM|nr:hypothetical protein JVT61DRAFT_10894 [Boletus reticuloceps]
MHFTSQFCLSLDHLPSNRSSNTAYLHRWSDVVPPKAALTFAALWDPEDGMVTFSGAALLESEGSSGGTSHADAFYDDYSQSISLDRDMDGDENTATLSTFQDVFKAFIRHTAWDSREHLNTKSGQGPPRASSTFDGLDVYSHDVQLKPRKSLQLSCMDLLDMESSFRTPSAFGRLRLRSDLMLDSYRLESDSEPGSRPSPMDSRFSTTTITTSNYIDVPPGAAHGTGTLPVPEWTEPKECVSPTGSWPFLPRRRVLRKRRPFDGDVTRTATSSTSCTPEKVTPNSPMSPSSSSCSRSPSARTFSSNATAGPEKPRRGRLRSTRRPSSAAPTPPNTSTKSPRLGLRFAFLSKRKPRQTSPDTDGWVCIEVTPIIKQYYIADLEED